MCYNCLSQDKVKNLTIYMYNSHGCAIQIWHTLAKSTINQFCDLNNSSTEIICHYN